MYQFKLLRKGYRWMAEVTATLSALQIVQSRSPKDLVRDLELQMYADCEKGGASPPEEVVTEFQCRLDGGVDVSLRGFVNKRKNHKKWKPQNAGTV